MPQSPVLNPVDTIPEAGPAHGGAARDTLQERAGPIHGRGFCNPCGHGFEPIPTDTGKAPAA